MMDNLRTTTNGFVLKIILSIIIVSIILTSISNYHIAVNNNYIAKVNGQEISRRHFENVLVVEYNRIHQQLGNKFYELATNEAYIKSLHKHTLNFLIDEVLLDQYSKRLGLETSDEQVKDVIFSTKMFLVNDKFDNKLYNNIINQMGITADQYAQIIRNQLTRQQLINAIVGTDFVLQNEANELISLITQQRVVREATININALVNEQQVSEDEIKVYYEQNKTYFKIPEQFRVSYIKLDINTMSERVSDSEIKSYYDQHQDQFIQAQRNLYSVIQTKTEIDAKAVLEELNNGTDFAVIAKAKSTDIISAKNGGSIGWLEEVTTPEELKNAGLKDKGQISGIIKSSVGFLVVQLNDIQPAKTKTLAEVHNDIAAKIKQKKTIDAFYILQQKVSNAASNDNQSLTSAEQAAGVKAVKTNWFGYDNLPQELNFKRVADTIFSGSLLDKNGIPYKNSDIIIVNDGLAFVLRMIGYKPKTINPLNVVKDQITGIIKYNKAELQTKLYAEKLLTKLKTGKEEILKTAGLSFGPAKILSRIDDDQISQAAFRLSLPTRTKPSYGITSDTQGNIVILALDEVKVGKLSENRKNAIIQSIIQKNAQITFEALISSLRKKAKIKFANVLSSNNHNIISKFS